MTGPRQARLCTVCAWRSFGDPKAVCPEHGKAKTVVQTDRPYRRRGMRHRV